jgi:hypothetical protein
VKLTSHDGMHSQCKIIIITNAAPSRTSLCVFSHKARAGLKSHKEVPLKQAMSRDHGCKNELK